MRPAVLRSASAVLLLGPTVLAFFAGGFFDGPRAVAAAVAWALVLCVALAGPSPLPTTTPGRVALAGLVGLTAWSALSLAWAPLTGPASDAVQRLLLYTATLLAAIGLLRDHGARRAAEPVLALGTLVVIGYGLAGRLLPSLVDLSRSPRAGGRLEQPITYWNSEGLLAAIGLILCARIAADGSRPTPMRAAAGAAFAPLGLGVYLSYSRGAAAVAVIGLIVLLAAAPTAAQLRAAVTAVATAVAVSACSAAFAGVASLEGSPGEQRTDGAVMLVILLAAMAAAGLLTARTARTEGPSPRTLRHARRLPTIAAAAVALCVVGLVVGGLGERAGGPEGVQEGPSRLASVESSRYEYWKIGLVAFGEDPLSGAGAGGFRVVWRQERDVREGVLEVHSIFLEMLGELGIPGLALLLVFLGGVAAGGRSTLRAGAAIAPGACAACSAWLLHAAIDWDLQVPAVTLPAVILAGALLVAREEALSAAESR